jgi:hypothetical protein
MKQFSRLTSYEKTLHASLAAAGKHGAMTWQELADFSKTWLESIGTAIANGWARPDPIAITTQLTAFRVFHRRSKQHFQEIAARARALTHTMRMAQERGDVTQRSLNRWNSEIRQLEEESRRVPRELRDHVVGLLLNLARTVDSGVEPLHPDDVVLWKKALVALGLIMDKTGNEATQNTAVLRDVGYMTDNGMDAYRNASPGGIVPPRQLMLRDDDLPQTVPQRIVVTSTRPAWPVGFERGNYLAIKKSAIVEILPSLGHLWAAFLGMPQAPQAVGEDKIDRDNAAMHREALARHQQNQTRILALTDLASRAVKLFAR